MRLFLLALPVFLNAGCETVAFHDKPIEYTTKSVAAVVPPTPTYPTVENYATSDSVAEASSVRRDEYGRKTWITGPELWYSDLPRNSRGEILSLKYSLLESMADKCFLQTGITDEGVSANWLYVIYTSTDWAFLERARDRQGSSLKTTVVDRIVNDGISEHVAVSLTVEYLEMAATEGLDVQLRGKRGSTVVKLPPHYVQGFLTKVRTISAAPAPELPTAVASGD